MDCTQYREWIQEQADRTGFPQGIAAALAPLREHGVDRDAMQPGGKLAAPLEAGQGAPGRDEAVLDAVLSQGGLPGEAQAQPIDLTHVRPVQGLEVCADHVYLECDSGSMV